MRKLSPSERMALFDVSQALPVEPRKLAALIDFESRWNPRAKNPLSSARGLLQFMRSTAGDLLSVHDVDHDGDRDSVDLILQYPTVEAQLRGPVLEYLARYAPFPTDQSLFMAVFYPAARRWPLDRPFPEKVQAANPGIETVGDYVNHVWRRVGDVEL